MGMRWWIPGRATRSREAAPGGLAPAPGCGARRRRPRPPLHRRSPNRSPRTGKREPGRDSRRRRRPRWLRRAAARAPPPPPPPPAGPPPWASPLCVGSRKSEGLGLDANGPLFAFTLFQTLYTRTFVLKHTSIDEFCAKARMNRRICGRIHILFGKMPLLE